MKHIISVLLICLTVTSICARPRQQNGWNDLFERTPGEASVGHFGWEPVVLAVPSTTAAPSTSTTASPEFLACLQTCPSTMEYNPVCGSDDLNYHNSARLDCAVRCGQNVQLVRKGTCQPL